MQNIPEIKLSYKIEFAKDFLDKKLVDKESEPDVLKVALRGYESTVTCIETNLMMKVVVVGFADGRIQSFYFYDMDRANVKAPEDFDGERPAGTPKSNLQTIVETDINSTSDSIKECTYFGHSGSVTSLSLNYDSYYCVSGSTDCTARLWSLKIGQCIAVFKSHVKSIWSVKLNPKGFHFASGGADSLIFLWLTNKSRLG
jgi:WD domain, G-beta repeat